MQHKIIYDHLGILTPISVRALGFATSAARLYKVIMLIFFPILIPLIFMIDSKHAKKLHRLSLALISGIRESRRNAERIQQRKGHRVLHQGV